ncbi:MAG: winged helix-turn-helix transcriptional regulator [Candidatus Methanofastidiosia archaeon]|jgi:DNA-binding Lrp family transcriptional regulator
MLKKKGVKITERQYELIKMFERDGSLQRVSTVNTNQADLSQKLGITRQALHTHLKSLKDEGLIRTGRGFIDLTEKALEFLEAKTGEAYIVIRTEPEKRRDVFNKISQLKFHKLCRTTGESDIICTVERKNLDNAITDIQKMEGIEETSTHLLLECKWE